MNYFRTSRDGWLTTVGIAFAAVTIGFKPALSTGVEPATSMPTTIPAGGDKVLVVIDPDSSVGQSFPLAAYLESEPSERLMKGDWLVVLYHRDCPACRRDVPTWVKQAESNPSSSTRTAFIEIPPIDLTEKPIVPPSERYLTTRLSDRQQWFIPMLTRFRLHDGKVVGAESGKERDGNK